MSSLIDPNPKPPKAGERVWYYQGGIVNQSPMPATVVRDSLTLVIDLVVFNMQNGASPIQASNHIDKENVNKRVRERSGGWSKNRPPEPKAKPAKRQTVSA